MANHRGFHRTSQLASYPYSDASTAPLRLIISGTNHRLDRSWMLPILDGNIDNTMSSDEYNKLLNRLKFISGEVLWSLKYELDR
jgi:hypothetical protein